MSLTETQKEQIRVMVSCNPSVENMARVAGLSDEEVLAELTIFKIDRLVLLNQEKEMIEQESQSCSNYLSTIEDLITLLEQ